MAAIKKTIVKDKTNSKKTINSDTNLLEYFRAGESYTSLVLGIVVVIIASILLLSLFKTRPDSQKGTTPNAISTVAKSTITPTPTLVQITSTAMKDSVTVTPTSIPSPTSIPTPTVKATPTSVPTPTVAPSKPVAMNNTNGPKSYTIVAGDDLWAIAVKVYGDGYKWTDIAKANNLTNPGIINVGNKLILPAEKGSPVAVTNTPTSNTKMVQPTTMPDMSSQKISGTTYTTIHDDTLWSIAVRAYGDGYKWVDIARANNLTDPNLIFGGNVIQIPR